MGKIEDLTGKRFGSLTVAKQGPTKISKTGRKQICWDCVCDCGNEVTVGIMSPATADGQHPRNKQTTEDQDERRWCNGGLS